MTEEVANYKKYIERRIQHAKKRVKETKAEQGTIVENEEYWKGFDLGYWKGIKAGYENALGEWEEQNDKSTQTGNIPD